MSLSFPICTMGGVNQKISKAACCFSPRVTLFWVSLGGNPSPSLPQEGKVLCALCLAQKTPDPCPVEGVGLLAFLLMGGVGPLPSFPQPHLLLPGRTPPHGPTPPSGPTAATKGRGCSREGRSSPGCVVVRPRPRPPTTCHRGQDSGGSEQK